MDFFVQAMTSNPRRPPSNPQGPPRQIPPYPPRHSPSPQPNSQHPPKPHFRYPQPPRPQPPPMMAPPVAPSNTRFPPPNYSSHRPNQHQQSSKVQQEQSQGYQYRGRGHNQRQMRGPSPPTHQYQDYEGYRERDQHLQNHERDRGYRDRRNQDNSYPPRHNQYNTSHHANPQYQRQDYNQNRRNNDIRAEVRPEERRQYQPKAQNRQPPPNRPQQRDERERNRDIEAPQKWAGRGRGRGRERGRGRGRGRGRPYQDAPAQKAEEQSQHSMEMESNEQSEKESSQRQSQSQSVYQERSSQSEEVQQQESESVEQQSQSAEEDSEQEQSGAMSPSSNTGSIGIQRIDTMVSKQEFQERLQTFKMNNRGGGLRLDTGRSFAIFQINKRTMEPELALTLKRFRRSTNRGEDQQEQDETADCPRSRKGLTATMRHILKEIIDADAMKPKDLAFPLPPGENKLQFLHIYDFLWNRMREMIKDVARLEIKQRGTQQVVMICEQMLRFFIIAIREGRLPHSCRLQFDSKMNLESITKILTQLLEIYQMAHYKMSSESQTTPYISPNQPEIIGYAILISNDLHKTLNEKLRIRLDGQGLGHPLLGFQEVETALAIKKSIRNRDYQTFYRMLESKEIDYVQSCLLIHNLPAIRREALRVLQKSAFPDVDTKVRKIPASALRRALGFSMNLTPEFYRFLQNIGLKVSHEKGEDIVFLTSINEALQDFKESYSFDFGYNKKERSSYQNCRPKQVLIDPRLISREQLLKRSWHQGNYINLCSQYYGLRSVGESQEDEELQQKPVSVPIPKEIIPSKQPENHQLDQKRQKNLMNLNFLMEKKKQLNRAKFLKSLEGLIETLVRRSDVHSQHQRKKGAAMIVQSLQVLRIATIYNVMQRFYEYCEYQKIAFQTIDHLSRFAQSRKKFIDNYYLGTFQLLSYNSTVNFRPLAEIVKTTTKPASQITALMTNLAESGRTVNKINALILFASSNSSPISKSHIKVIKNIFHYLSDHANQSSRQESQLENLCFLRSTKPYIQLKRYYKTYSAQIELKVRFYHYRAQQSQQPFLCGYDSIIFLDLHGSSKIFEQLLSDLTENRNKVMKQVLGKSLTLRTSLTTLLVCEMDKLRQMVIQQKISSSNSNWYFLQKQSIKLSLPIKHNISQALVSAQLAQKPPVFELQVVTITSILNQIYQNMQFAQSLHTSTSSLEFFQRYFTTNIKYLREVISEVVALYQCLDWCTPLLQSAYLVKPTQGSTQLQVGQQILYPSQKVSWDELLSNKLLFANEITRLLGSINLIQRWNKLRRERPYITASQILAGAVEEYLQLFEKDERVDSLQLICEYVIDNNCSLVFTDGKIQGDSRALVDYIMVQLKKHLKYLTILLPKGFKFKLSKKDFQKSSMDKKIESPTICGSDKPVSKAKFSYKNQALLSDLIEELKNEQKQHFKFLRAEGYKAIKI